MAGAGVAEPTLTVGVPALEDGAHPEGRVGPQAGRGSGGRRPCSSRRRQRRPSRCRLRGGLGVRVFLNAEAADPGLAEGRGRRVALHLRRPHPECRTRVAAPQAVPAAVLHHLED